VGGGSLPGETLPTALLALDVPAPDAFAARLRGADTPIIARIAEGRVLFDPRTVLPGQDDALLDALKSLVPQHK
jgi:L-seryl-tRNA(Ser) seleniumtransferase